MAETPEPAEPNGPPDPMAPLPVTRRSYPAAERAPLPPDIEEQFNQLLVNVQVLTAHFFGETAAPPSETLRERTARRVKKFHRATGDERVTPPATGEEPASDAPSENIPDPKAGVDEAADPLAHNKNIAWPRQNSAGEGFVPEPAARRWWQRRPSLGVWLGAQALALLLLILGYLIGHATSNSSGRNRGTNQAGHTAVDLFGRPELTEQAIQTASTALHAEHSGDADAARKIYETALTKHVGLSGINYRLALLAVQRNDRLEAEQRLERSMLDGEYVPDCCYVLARLAADKGDFEEAADQFQTATRAQPFDGKYFFYWGELLRRQGKPQAAVAAFEQALDRPYNAESGDLYLFKQRLAKVEFGHDDAFNTELANHLKEAPVAGEWMLLAAAQDLDHQAYTAAAEHLKLASDRLPSATYAALIHDYLFQTSAKRSEVAALLNHVPQLAISSAGPTVLDPGQWLPERGDPAMWPSANNQSP